MLRHLIGNPKCQELVSHVDLHWQMARVPSVRYLVSRYDHSKWFALLQYRLTELRLLMIVFMMTTLRELQTIFRKKDNKSVSDVAPESTLTVDSSQQVLTSRTVKSWVDDKDNDALVLAIDISKAHDAAKLAAEPETITAILKD